MSTFEQRKPSEHSSKRAVFRRGKIIRRFLYLLLLGALAFGEYWTSGYVRRTFIFYTLGEDAELVEERMMARSPSREFEIQRYVEDALLGAVSPESSLFPRGTKLEAILYRDGVVYADLSEAAALPPDEVVPARGGYVFRSLYTLEEGIRRNFAFVKEVKLFVDGNMVIFPSL
jgi:spore germination protein GerM